MSNGDFRLSTASDALDTMEVMRSLDPIISLTVAMAEAPGSYAMLLGSGVSRDAGVPTGSDVFWIGVGELYRMENECIDTPDREVLGKWLKDSDRDQLNYSELLELITPDPATRRDYLAKHFAGAVPSDTHKGLARLCASGAVKVFVTTNFDRLLEHALRDEGIEPVVVTCEADLVVAPRREHESCFIIKAHGDYLQETIRNTPDELASLEPRMTREIAEVFDRYGVVVLGYSGSDEAVGHAIRQRSGRYGLYWVSRGDLDSPAKALVEATAGRVIQRPGASQFLSDMQRKLASFQAHPSGDTPRSVNSETIQLLRKADRVGLAEFLRRERREFNDGVLSYIASCDNAHPLPDVVKATYEALLPILERRLASLLPLVEHDADLFAEEVSAWTDIASRVPKNYSYTFWPELPTWCIWRLAYTCGAYACNIGKLAALESLFHTRRPHSIYDDTTDPIVETRASIGGGSIGAVIVGKAENGADYFAPDWMSLLRDVADMELLQECYPDFVSDAGQPDRSLVAFDLLLGMALGMQGDEEMAHWKMHSDDAKAFALRVRADSRLIDQLASALRISPAEFPAKAVEGLERTHAYGGGINSHRGGRTIEIFRAMIDTTRGESFHSPIG